MRSPNRSRPATIDRDDWASQCSAEAQSIHASETRQKNNPFHEDSQHSVTRSVDNTNLERQAVPRLDSQLMTTTNFSDVLGGNRLAMQREEIATDRLDADAEDQDKLDELEKLALEALDEI